jgi:hypothetical protein
VSPAESPERPGYALPVSSSAVARAIFALLVVATIAAFFVTQELKSADPAVKRLALQRYVSPNGDGRKETASISFDLPDADRVTVDVVDGGGDRVRRLVDGRRLSAGTHRLSWDGRNDRGRVPPDGVYYVRVTLRNQGRAVTSPRGIELVTTPPRPRVLSAKPFRVEAGRPVPVTVRFTGPSVIRAVFRVWRTDGGSVREVARFTALRGQHVATWNGRVRGGRPAPEGTYAMSVTVQNRALIEGSAPGRLPPERAQAAPGTGVRVAGPEPLPPLEPVRRGGLVVVPLQGVERPYAWSFGRLGSSRPLRRGRAGPGQLSFRVPRGARTGMHLVRIATASRTLRVPVVVRDGRDRRVLVVIPALTWEGRNAVDDDFDGFADTLDVSPRVDLTRPFAGGRLPAGFGVEIEPLLQYLDRRKLPYDLTTDLALARERAPSIEARRGVVLAGDERWLTPRLLERLRVYVRDGGRLASFGTESLRRTVTLTPGALTRPSPPQPHNAFGEATRPVSSLVAPLVVTADTIGLFRGTDGVVGLFTRFEQAERPADAGQLVAAAGREADHPAFAAYRIGRGLYVRTGTSQWSRSLVGRPEVGLVTRRLWAELSR